MLLRQATLGDGRVTDVRIDGMSITAVDTDLLPHPEEEVIDLAGHLLLPSLIEPHAHLDKAFLAETIDNPSGDLLGAIEAMHANRHRVTFDDTVERATRAARMMASRGVTAIRTHADVTTGNGLMSVEALSKVADDLRDLVHIEVVALVGTPLTGPEGKQNLVLLREALAAGADIVGGCPHLEDDVGAATAAVMEIAAEAGLGVDLHTDETLDPSKLGLADLARWVLDNGFPCPVTASHCVSLGMVDAGQQREIAALVAEANVSVVTLPHTNLYLQGRQFPQAMPRGLTPIKALRDAGANVAAGADNVQDPFNPLGNCDPLQTAALLVLTAHLAPAEAVAMCSTNTRLALAREAVDVLPGYTADLVALPAASVREAVAFAPPRSLVIREGRVMHRAC